MVKESNREQHAVNSEQTATYNQQQSVATYNHQFAALDIPLHAIWLLPLFTSKKVQTLGVIQRCSSLIPYHSVIAMRYRRFPCMCAPLHKLQNSYVFYNFPHFFPAHPVTTWTIRHNLTFHCTKPTDTTYTCTFHTTSSLDACTARFSFSLLLQTQCSRIKYCFFPFRRQGPGGLHRFPPDPSRSCSLLLCALE